MSQNTAFSTHLDRIEAMLNDSAARYSLEETLAQLAGLREQAAADSPAQPALRRIGLLTARLEALRNQLPAARDAYLAALALVAPQPVSPLFETYAHYGLACVARDLGEFDLAATHFLRASELAPPPPQFTVSRQLGIRQQLGYALHEAGRFAEALAVNQALLLDAERAFGATDGKLTGVLTNIGQNIYALGQPAEAMPYLRRCQQIARHQGDVPREQDLLFQLGVLAFESGRPDEARTLMTERVLLLTRHKDLKRLAAARAALSELEKRIAALR